MDASQYSNAEVESYRAAFAVIRRRYRRIRWMERAAEVGFALLALGSCVLKANSEPVRGILAGLLVAAFIFRAIERRTWKCPACQADLKEAMDTEVCPQCRLVLAH